MTESPGLNAAWERIPGWFSRAKAQVLQRAVSGLSAGARVVELGSFHGRSSVAIARALPPQSLLFCVDHFQGSAEHQGTSIDLSQIFHGFLETIERHGVQDLIRVRRQATLQAVHEFAADSVDLILHDAAHDAQSVVADLTAWYPKLKPEGLLFCDDYEPA